MKISAGRPEKGARLGRIRGARLSSRPHPGAAAAAATAGPPPPAAPQQRLSTPQRQEGARGGQIGSEGAVLLPVAVEQGGGGAGPALLQP